MIMNIKISNITVYDNIKADNIFDNNKITIKYCFLYDLKNLQLKKNTRITIITKH